MGPEERPRAADSSPSHDSVAGIGAAELVPLVYEELREQAARCLRSRLGRHREAEPELLAGWRDLDEARSGR